MSRAPLLPPDLDASKTKRDLSWSFAAQGIAKIVSYVLLAVLARHLSKEAFGQLLYATAVALTLVPLTDPGTRRHLLREVAASPARALERFSAVLSLRIALCAPYLALVVAAGIFLRPEILGALVLAGLFVLLRSLWGAAGALLQGLRRIGFAVVATGLSQVLLLALVLALVASGAGIEGVLTGYAISYALLLGVGLAFVARRVGPFRLRWRRAGLALTARAALPFFLLDALQVAHFKLDTLILGLLRGYEEVALYESSARLLEASQFGMRPVMAIFLPICASLASEGRWLELDRLVRGLLLRAAGLGAAIAVAVVVAAPLAVVFVYGRDFAEAAPLLRILYLSTPFLFAGFALLFVVGAMHLERSAVRVALATVLVNVAGNLAVIPRFGAAGAAATTVATHALLAAGLARLYARGLRSKSR